VQRGRLELLLVLLVFAAPFLAAEWAFRHWRPERPGNYGTLLGAREFAPAGLEDGAGRPFDLASLRGRWVLLVAAPGGCGESCRRNLRLVRQLRLASGRDRGRIERLLLTATRLDADLAREHPGMHQALSKDVPALDPELGRPDVGRHVYVLDPLGRMVLRFPPEADGARMLQDLKRLLKYSKPGRG